MREIDANWFMALWQGHDQYYESRYDIFNSVEKITNISEYSAF